MSDLTRPYERFCRPCFIAGTRRVVVLDSKCYAGWKHKESGDALCLDCTTYAYPIWTEEDLRLHDEFLRRHVVEFGAPPLEVYRSVYAACGVEWPGDAYMYENFPVADHVASWRMRLDDIERAAAEGY